MNFWGNLLGGASSNTSVKTDQLKNVIGQVQSVVTAVLGVITVGVMVLAIIIAFKFFTADDDGKRKNAKAQLIYAIIGIVVLIALMILAPTITGFVQQAASGQ